MDLNENKTNEILAKLKNLKPVLSQPEMLTKNIMDALPPIKNKKAIYLNRIRYFSGAAAVFFIALFTYQQNEPETLYFLQPKSVIKYEVSENEHNFYSNWSELNLSMIYRCYLSNNVNKNKHKRNYSQQFKEIYYENND